MTARSHFDAFSRIGICASRDPLSSPLAGLQEQELRRQLEHTSAQLAPKDAALAKVEEERAELQAGLDEARQRVTEARTAVVVVVGAAGWEGVEGMPDWGRVDGHVERGACASALIAWGGGARV
jgi:hypothetical protein